MKELVSVEGTETNQWTKADTGSEFFSFLFGQCSEKNVLRNAGAL